MSVINIFLVWASLAMIPQVKVREPQNRKQRVMAYKKFQIIKDLYGLAGISVKNREYMDYIEMRNRFHPTKVIRKIVENHAKSYAIRKGQWLKRKKISMHVFKVIKDIAWTYSGNENLPAFKKRFESGVSKYVQTLFSPFLGFEELTGLNLTHDLDGALPYNSSYRGLADYIIGLKMQCFSGTIGILSALYLSKSRGHFRRNNLVGVIRPGHIFMGQIQKKKLIGLETTGHPRGDSLIKYGFLKDLKEDTRIVDAELLLYFVALQPMIPEKYSHSLVVLAERALGYTRQIHREDINRKPISFSLSQNPIQRFRNINISVFGIPGKSTGPAKDLSRSVIRNINKSKLNFSDGRAKVRKQKKIKKKAKKKYQALKVTPNITNGKGPFGQKCGDTFGVSWNAFLVKKYIDPKFKGKSGTTFCHIAKDCSYYWCTAIEKGSKKAENDFSLLVNGYEYDGYEELSTYRNGVFYSFKKGKWEKKEVQMGKAFHLHTMGLPEVRKAHSMFLKGKQKHHELIQKTLNRYRKNLIKFKQKYPGILK